MKLKIRWHSLVSLIVVVCLLSTPVFAFGKKGKEHFDRGMKLEQAEQWEKAAQEFTLALAADPSNADYQLHYRRSVFNASQTFMQQGRALAEQRDYVGAYNAFRQAYGYDPVNQLAVSEMERMLRLQEVKEGNIAATAATAASDGAQRPEVADGGGTPPTTSTVKPQESIQPPKPEPMRTITFSGDLKTWIRKLADELNLNVMFDRQTFAQPRTVDVNLRDVTTAKALDLIFLQEGLFFQKLDRRTILVADQARRQQFQQMVIRTFYLANMKPTDAQKVIVAALPASVGRPQSIVVIDDATNSLSVRDTAENVKLIGEILQSLDKDRAEVVMDVDIYEVSRSSLFQLGNQLGNAGSNTTFPLGGFPGLSVLTGNATTSRNSTGVNVAAIATNPTAAAAALVIPSSVLTAFQSKNNARLLASTQIHAFNGEESTARIGQRVPVQTASVYGFTQPTTTTGTGAANNVSNGVFGSNGYPVINYEPTGLTLSFTPQVFPNLDVQVKMKIESKDVSGESTLTPTFTERTITGTARVQNNRTMMLASVSQDVQSTGRQGLPVLSGLPLVGRLFSSPTKNNRQVDIVISVTPRVLRAPAVTPRDEENRNSGTLQSPTTGSVEAMLAESAREEQIAARVAAARQIPKDVVVRAADPVTYAPVAAAATDQTNGNANQPADTAAAPVIPVAQTNAPAQTQPAGTTLADKQSASVTNTPNSAMPQPKSGAASSQPQSMDVVSALRNLVSPKTLVAETSLTAKSDPSVAGTVEQIAPKSEKIDTVAASNQPLSGVTELRIAPDKNELVVGDKRQIAVEFASAMPLGLAVVTLRFDPHVIRIIGVSAGKIFAGAKTAPVLTQSTDQNGLLLVSLAPAAGSTLSGEGGLINIDLEAINAGDSGLVFDVANVHLVAADGRSGTLALRPASLTVKPPEAPAPKSNPDQTSAPAAKPDTPDDQILTSALGINLSTGFGTPGSAVTTKSYVVQKHDNLWSIASQHSVTVADLRKANPSLRNGVLSIGRELLIP